MKIRQQWAAIIATTTIECRRCNKPIHPWQPWDLGHPQQFPYAAGNTNNGLQPEHRRCNRGNHTTNLDPTFRW